MKFPFKLVPLNKGTFDNGGVWFGAKKPTNQQVILAVCIKYWHMDVSENSGTPKSSILIGFSIINHPFWGTTIFGNTYMVGRRGTKSCHPRVGIEKLNVSHCNLGFIDLWMEIQIIINWTSIYWIKSASKISKQPTEHKSRHHPPMLNLKWWTSIGCTQIIQTTHTLRRQHQLWKSRHLAILIHLHHQIASVT